MEVLCKELSRNNLSPLSINLKIHLGDDIFDPRKLAQALPGCDQVIIVVSKAYTISPWLLSESLAFFKLMAPGPSLLLAVVENCDIPFHLKNLPSEDFRGIDLQSVENPEDSKHTENTRKFRRAAKSLISHIDKDPQAFVIMRFRRRRIRFHL